MKKIINLLFLLLLPFITWAQSDIEMADVMKSNGKIYVVVAVLAVIFSGILIFLISIDLRLRKMEEKSKNPHSN